VLQRARAGGRLADGDGGTGRPVRERCPARRRTAVHLLPLFTSCDGRYECADVRVPLDYANPGGPTIDIAIARQPARDQANKLGILLVNPGGPGGSGIEAVEGGAVPADVAARFDVIGFDPRGVGRSDALACPVGPDTPYDGDPDPGDPAGEAATDAAVNRYVDSCVQRHRDLLPHVGTRDVARDMDRIREALGEQQLNYFGLSYGTSIGQTYGDMFPSRIRAMILDGVVDLALPGLDVSQAESFENSLRQFAANCSANPSCPVRADPIGVVDRVRAKVAAAPIPVPGSRPLTAGRFEMGVVITLYSTQTWPALSRALAAADGGDPRAMSRGVLPGQQLRHLQRRHLHRHPLARHRRRGPRLGTGQRGARAALRRQRPGQRPDVRRLAGSTGPPDPAHGRRAPAGARGGYHQRPGHAVPQQRRARRTPPRLRPADLSGRRAHRRRPGGALRRLRRDPIPDRPAPASARHDLLS